MGLISNVAVYHLITALVKREHSVVYPAPRVMTQGYPRHPWSRSVRMGNSMYSASLTARPHVRIRMDHLAAKRI